LCVTRSKRFFWPNVEEARYSVLLSNDGKSLVEARYAVRNNQRNFAKVTLPSRATDDCGFSPFADDTSTSRETAFAKIKSRVEGTLMAARPLGT
jgi:hypothetical protein